MTRFQHPASDSSRKHEKPVFLIFALLALGLAHGISDAVFLCVLYGVRSFHAQKLHFLDIRNGQPWHVSNGDEIAANLQPLHFVITALIWLIFALAGFALFRRLLPNQNETFPGPVDANLKTNSTIPVLNERRVFIERNRFLRNRAIGLVVCWVMSMVALTLLAPSIGRLSLLLIPVLSLALLGYYIRLRERHFIGIMTAATCPVCGQVPMHFEITGEEKSAHKLLVCDTCHIEWDCGRL